VVEHTGDHRTALRLAADRRLGRGLVHSGWRSSVRVRSTSTAGETPGIFIDRPGRGEREKSMRGEAASLGEYSHKRESVFDAKGVVGRGGMPGPICRRGQVPFTC
jgi:hypothetical protein